MKNTTTTTTTPRPRLAPLLALLAACGARDPEITAPTPPPIQQAEAAPPAPAPDPTMTVAEMRVPDNNEGSQPMNPLSLRWSLAPKDGALAVDYTVHNDGDAAVWLLDRTLVPKVDGVHPAFDRVTLIAGEAPGLARLVLGHVRPSPGNTVASEYTPGARRLEPGATAEGHLVLPLPLASWSPYLTLDPLAAPPDRAVLELGWLSDDAPPGVPAWDEWTPVIGAADLRVPTLSYTVQRQRLARGEVLPLP